MPLIYRQTEEVAKYPNMAKYEDLLNDIVLQFDHELRDVRHTDCCRALELFIMAANEDPGLWDRLRQAAKWNAAMSTDEKPQPPDLDKRETRSHLLTMITDEINDGE